MEIEGTWEQVLEHASELRGRRVRLTVLTTIEGGLSPADVISGSDRQSRMVAAWDKYEQTRLTEEETAILDEFEQFRREHPIQFRVPTLLDDPE